MKTSQSLEKALSSITYCTWMISNFMEKKESELDQLVQTVRILSRKQDRSADTWLWLRKGVLKKETEGLIMAAQD